MGSKSPSPDRQLSAHSGNQDHQSKMGRALRTPSPAPEPYLSSAETTPFQNSRAAPGLTDGSDDKVQLPQHVVSEHVPRQPQTPAFRRIETDWHGLPSPQTPNISRNITKQEIDDNGDSKNYDDQNQLMWDIDANILQSSKQDEWNAPLSPGSSSPKGSSCVYISPDTQRELQTPERLTDDLELALQLEALASPSSIRRSTRLHDKVKTKVGFESPTKLVKPVKPVKRSTDMSQAAENTAQTVLTFAEPTASPFELAISPDNELPVLHSATWQLQYPPGGSTHPSYPWPTADPRLVFQPHHVPLRNGLPDVSYVPALVLPMGWRQACWSGLNPVVFDPYQQAFKLTPVGPLPLTCEEVQQGGLKDYIPGGKLHPEYGLLPLLSALSDGSDAEIFNFEGINWTLPWAQIEGVPENNSNLESLATNTAINTEFGTTSVAQLQGHYLEARDCPDDVFDLQDGWRWLIDMQQTPPTMFTPTPGRKWRGTGVQRTSRKTKQPIAALMAITMAEPEDDNMERYLGNQNCRDFCAFKSVATPVHINITLLQDVEFTLVELLCYFPLHYQWRKGADRLSRARMSARDIANFINMTRCLPATSVCSYGSVDHHVFRIQTEDEVRAKASCSNTEVITYTAEYWTYDVWEMTDYPLLALAHGLRELPSGVDAGPLTAVIKWVRENGRHQTMLSEVPALLKEADIGSLIDPGDSVDPDQEVLPRHIEAIKKDRLRVLQEKKELDAGKERKAKKSKTK